MAAPQRWGSVFDRLYDPVTYTGVYAERFRSGPGINQDTDASAARHLHAHTQSFTGSTRSPGAASPSRTGSPTAERPIRDIGEIMRPHLSYHPSSPPVSAAESSFWSGDSRASGAVPQPPPGMTPRDAPPQPEAVPVPLDTNTQLQLIFQYYCRFGRTSAGEDANTLDSFNWMKCAKESPGLLEGLLTPTEMDLIFVKCKAKNARRLTYGQFLDALSAAACVRYPMEEDPAEAFSLLLANHLFQCPASLGIAAALKSGMLQLAPHTSESRRSASPRGGLSHNASFASASASPAGMARGPSIASMASESAMAQTDAPRMMPAPKGRASPATSAPAAVPNLSTSSDGGAAAAALLAAAQQAGFPTPPPGMPWPYPYPWPVPAQQPGAPAGTPSFAGVSPPADVYEAITRKALEAKMSTASMSAAAAPGPYYWPYPFPMPAPGTAWPGMPAPAPVAAAPEPVDTSFTRGRDSARPRSALPTPSSAASMRRLAEAASPRGAPPSPRSGSPRRMPSLSSLVVSTPGADISARPRSPRLSRSPSQSTLGTAEFRPTIAGSANKPGGVYDRLASPASFTGVYRRAWLTDGRINHFADTGVSNIPSAYVGDTNTGSNEIIHDIRFLLRPNLNVGKGFR